jgi:hypothetical protein
LLVAASAISIYSNKIHWKNILSPIVTIITNIIISTMKFSLCLLILPAVARAQGDFEQEEPTAPPTSQFQGPESGYIRPIAEGSGPQVNQDRVVDFAYCYVALARHDDNLNQRIDEVEYLDFAQDFGKNTECLGTLTELPLELRVVWNQLSCECRARGGAADCCLGPNAHIPVTGVGVSKQDPAILLEEQQFLRQACLRTDQAIITFCGPPPIPIIPGPPPAFPVRSAGPTGLTKAEKSGIIIAAIIAFLICCCPWRRRWIFCAGGKPDDSSDESSSESEDESEDGGGMRHVVTEEGGGDLDADPPVAGAPDIE